MNALRILETSLYTDDLEQAESFYTSVLGFQLFAKEPGRHLFFQMRQSNAVDLRSKPHAQ